MMKWNSGDPNGIYQTDLLNPRAHGGSIRLSTLAMDKGTVIEVDRELTDQSVLVTRGDLLVTNDSKSVEVKPGETQVCRIPAGEKYSLKALVDSNLVWISSAVVGPVPD